MLKFQQSDYGKMSTIFHAFDRDVDGKLNRAELTDLIRQSNPLVQLTPVQLSAIIEEVSSYGSPSLHSTSDCTINHGLLKHLLLTGSAAI